MEKNRGGGSCWWLPRGAGGGGLPTAKAGDEPRCELGAATRSSVTPAAGGGGAARVVLGGSVGGGGAETPHAPSTAPRLLLLGRNTPFSPACGLGNGEPRTPCSLIR